MTILLRNSNDLIYFIDGKNNKDIRLKDINLDGFKIKTTVHCNNTVYVIVGCSQNLIMMDYYGTMKLTAGLARAEDRLQIILDEYIKSNNTNLQHHLIPPSHMTRIVKMWHWSRFINRIY